MGVLKSEQLLQNMNLQQLSAVIKSKALVLENGKKISVWKFSTWSNTKVSRCFHTINPVHRRTLIFSYFFLFFSFFFCKAWWVTGCAALCLSWVAHTATLRPLLQTLSRWWRTLAGFGSHTSTNSTSHSEILYNNIDNKSTKQRAPVLLMFVCVCQCAFVKLDVIVWDM